jgi:hypothetical protein
LAWARNSAAADIDDELAAANIERTSSMDIWPWGVPTVQYHPSENCANPDCEFLRHSVRPTARDSRPKLHCCARCYHRDPRCHHTIWSRALTLPPHDSHCEGLSRVAITVTDH